jgi:LCP family protein required for cell wall assembly
LAATLSLLLAAGSAYGLGLYVWANAKLKRVPVNFLSKLPCHNGCNYLVLGSDSRAGLSPSERIAFGSEETVGGQRSDTIILVHLDSERQKAIILSFPRDMWVNIPDYGYNKITSAYSFGGPSLAVRTVHDVTGLDINGFVSVDLAGFQKVVNALGGVPICVDRPLYDPLAGLNLPHAGCYNLNGFQALAFVRARHVCGDTIPDFARISRQQQFLRAVINKVLSFRNVLHAQSTLGAVAGNLTVSKNVNLADLIHLTREIQGISTGDAAFRAVPSTTGGEYLGGQYVSVVHPIEPQASMLFKRLRNGKPLGRIGIALPQTEISTANVRVRVYNNGSGKGTFAVHDKLDRAGFDIGRSLAASVVRRAFPKLPFDRSMIIYGKGAKRMGDRVHDYLSSLVERTVPRTVLGDVDVAVVIGSDYQVPTPSQTSSGSSTSAPSGC